MEAFSGLLVLAALGGVFFIMLRPPSSGATQRRRWIVDGRHRDRDPLSASMLLVLFAVVDLEQTTGGHLDADRAFALGVVFAVILQVKSFAQTLQFLIGAAALLTTLYGLVQGTDCGSHLTSSQRSVVFLGTAGFLALVAVFRLAFAPLRASRLEARGAFLAVYGVLQSLVFLLQLDARGGLSGVDLRSGAIGVGCLIALALGTAVQPMFATAVLGLGLSIAALISSGVTGCIETTSLIGIYVGFFVALAVKSAVLHRGNRSRTRR